MQTQIIISSTTYCIAVSLAASSLVQQCPFHDEAIGTAVFDNTPIKLPEINFKMGKFYITLVFLAGY